LPSLKKYQGRYQQHAYHRLKRLRKHRQGTQEVQEEIRESKVLLKLRERQSYTKPSVKRRGEVLKAIYKQQIASGKIEL